MNYLFLCGSLEPGRDGVGDYVRCLAIELIKMGHNSSAIALNDYYTDSLLSESQMLEQVSLPVLRLPSIWQANKRFANATQWMKELEVDWISLQFVPYSFQAKGLPVFLYKQLGRIIKDVKLHIMFHEAWLGIDDGANYKLRILSSLQKAIIENLLRKLQPNIIHTHIPIYKSRLQRLGWSAMPLPLFSNIPMKLLFSKKLEPNIFRIGIFSQTDTSNAFIEFLVKVSKQLAKNNQLCQVILIGGQLATMKAFKSHLENVSAFQGEVHCTGFLEASQISAMLQTCHLGLTPIPKHALGKSGTVAAFLSHGIPVAAPIVHYQDMKKNIGFFNEILCLSILSMSDIYQSYIAKSYAQKAQQLIQVSEIAKRFINDLEMTQNNC